MYWRSLVFSHLLEDDAVAEPKREEHCDMQEDTYRQREQNNEFDARIICYLIFHHSYLKALIGSNEAAFLAGYHPKKIPVAAHTTKESITAEVLTIKGIPCIIDNPYETNNPNTIPMSPPMRLNITLSQRN